MHTRKLLRQVLALFVTCAFALGTIGVLGGCAKAEEDELLKITEETFDTLKHPTKDNLEPFIEGFESDYSSLKTYGTDIYEFLTHSNAKLSYEVDSVVIDGKKAQVNLKLTNVDIQAAAEAAQTDLIEHIDEYMDIVNSDNGDVELVKMFVQKYYELVDASTDMTTNDCTLKFERDDDEWELSEKSCQELLEMPLSAVVI